MPNKFYPLPQVGDIVWCIYPQVIGVPGPKPRPAIVSAVSPSTHEVEVVYGTSKKTSKIYPTEFVLDPQDPGFSLSGLGYRTKFDVAHRVRLPFDNVWFGVSPAKKRQIPLPKLGSLHPSCITALQVAAGNAARQRGKV
jgi:hypothetical protein